MNGSCVPFSEAQTTLFSVSFGENKPSPGKKMDWFSLKGIFGTIKSCQKYNVPCSPSRTSHRLSGVGASPTR
jgi:hypothetical protein